MPQTREAACTAAIFVGGASSRMGTAKGRLRSPLSGKPLILHLLDVCEQAGLDKPGPICLVGRAEPYEDLLGARGAPPVRLRDAPSGIGPLGGLRAALRYVASGSQDINRVVDEDVSDRASDSKSTGGAVLITLACDMPFVEEKHLRELIRAAACYPEAAIVKPAGRPHEPMLSVYRAAKVLPAVDQLIEDGRHGLQALFSHPALGGDVVELPREPFARALLDWDTPEDVQKASLKTS